MFLLVWFPIVFVRVISLNSCRREQGHELQLNHRDRICSRKKTARKKKYFLVVFPVMEASLLDSFSIGACRLYQCIASYSVDSALLL